MNPHTPTTDHSYSRRPHVQHSDHSYSLAGTSTSHPTQGGSQNTPQTDHTYALNRGALHSTRSIRDNIGVLDPQGGNTQSQETRGVKRPSGEFTYCTCRNVRPI